METTCIPVIAALASAIAALVGAAIGATASSFGARRQYNVTAVAQNRHILDQHAPRDTVAELQSLIVPVWPWSGNHAEQASTGTYRRAALLVSHLRLLINLRVSAQGEHPDRSNVNTWIGHREHQDRDGRGRRVSVRPRAIIARTARPGSRPSPHHHPRGFHESTRVREESMKALAFNEFGGPDRLRLQDVPDPKIEPGDVLVRVRACALNHLDLFVREGIPALKTPLPFWTGCDIAGDVAEVGSAVQGVKVGDRVCVNPNLTCGRCEFCRQGEDSMCLRFGIVGEHTPGGLAELVTVRGDNTVKLPDGIGYEEAAAFILVNLTAWRMLVTQAAVRPGEDVLILGVGGGVSSTAVQIAKLCGARVWVTSSSDAKLERARALGADECINYLREDWAKVVFERTGRRGVDVVVENVGAATWKQSLRSLAKGGRLVTCGATTGPIGETDIRIVFWNQLRIIGSTMGNRREFDTVMEQFFRGRLKAIVDEVVPLRDGADAQRRLAEGKQFGKIVLTP